MGKINVLSFDIANLIAAGEVVDRPASVLKELLENAIDAGGTHITAEIRAGGVRSIRVTDDGCGMDAEDMPVALRRHATSKIKNADDLNGIMTLGFRGEALAAISSVSDITLISKTHEAKSATMLRAEGGSVTEVSEVGAADGTTVLVENLFGRVPARRKFLKKDSSEAMACTAQMEKVVMSHPEIAFRFLVDGQMRFATAGDGDIRNVLYALYGRDFAGRLLAVDGEGEGVGVSGYVGRSDNSYGNRNMQNVFINGRYVKSKTVMAALERAYTSYMAPERYPVCTLYLKIDPRHVDVNVHPAKLEVRFSDERKVFEAVYWAVRAALEQNTERPELKLSQQPSFRHPPAQNAFVPVGGQDKATQLKMPPSVPAPKHSAPPAAPQAQELSPAASLAFLKQISEAEKASLSADMTLSDLKAQEQVPPHQAKFPSAFPTDAVSAAVQPRQESGHTAASVETPEGQGGSPASNAEACAPAVPEYRFIGEAFRTYLFVEVGEEVLVIDQHAAHERILFEEMLRRQKSDGRVASQGLLIPLRVNLTPEELSAALENEEELGRVGFSFLHEAGGVSLVSVPDSVSVSDAAELFGTMVAELSDGSGNPEVTEAKRRERALYQIACKAAIKGGRAYGEAQLDHLIRQVLALPDVTVCPHGRPIAYRLTKRELDKFFDRIK